MRVQQKVLSGVLGARKCAAAQGVANPGPVEVRSLQVPATTL